MLSKLERPVHVFVFFSICAAVFVLVWFAIARQNLEIVSFSNWNDDSKLSTTEILKKEQRGSSLQRIFKPDTTSVADLKLVTTNTIPSYKMFVLNRSTDDLSRLYLNNETFEPTLQQQLKKCLEKSKKKSDIVFFDIGANFGIHSLYMAALNYSVIAVEADVATFSILTNSINANRFFDKIQAFNAAITSTRGNIEMLRNTNNVGNNQIIKNPIDVPFSKEFVRHTVRGVKLDDLLPFISQEEVVLKIDIEGHECHVLNSQQARVLFTSKKVTCVAMEFTPKSMGTDEKCVAEMIHLLNSFGYVPYFATDGDQMSKKIEITSMYDKVNGDVLWLPYKANPAEYFSTAKDNI